MPKILVLAIDKDDDVGKKTGIKGPIIGKEKNIEVAKKMLLKDPGESDGNTIFEAVKWFDEVKDAVDVATLTGHKSRTHRADESVRNQLKSILTKYKNIDGIYLVTDGADDDDLVPVIQSEIKILSKKTCIVKQSKQLEKEYYVIKEALKDPHFARVIFGLPGIILLAWALFQDLGIKIVVLLIGIYLIIKGFGIEESMLSTLNDFRKTVSTQHATFPLYIGALLTTVLSVLSGYERIAQASPNWLMQTTYFVDGALTLFMLSIILFLVARIGDFYYRKEILRMKKYVMSFVTSFTAWLVVSKAVSLIIGDILIDEFIAFVMIAVLATIAGLALVRYVYTSFYIVSKLSKYMEVYDRYGTKIGEVKKVDKKKNKLYMQKEKIKISNVLLVNKAENYAVVR